MSGQQPASAETITFTRTQWRVLRALRASYAQDPDLWTDRELAHLRFLRWLYRTGRLAS